MTNKPVNREQSASGCPAASRQPPYWRALVALTISFCIISVVGVWFVYGFWARRNAPVAVARGAAFVAIMAGVHFLGYRAWRRQFTLPLTGESQSATWSEIMQSSWSPPPPISSAYGRPMITALIQQGVVLILGALMLDMGLTFHIAILAVIAFWLAVGIVVARRPAAPTCRDLFVVRYGFLLVFVAILVVAPFVWEAMGRL